MGFVDSWAAVASGGLSLSENHLYTVEAFQAYYDHLTPDGELVILRWDVDVPRLVSNAVALLGRGGGRPARGRPPREARGHREDPPQMIFMLKKRPFTPEETAADGRVAGRRSRSSSPAGTSRSPTRRSSPGRTSFAEYVAAGEDARRPRLRRPALLLRAAEAVGAAGRHEASLRCWILAPSSCCACSSSPSASRRASRLGPYAGSVVYFASLGVGFIAVELALLQHLTLLLGHPIFTLSILLFTLLAVGRPRQRVERPASARAGVPRRRGPRRRLRARAAAARAARSCRCRSARGSRSPSLVVAPLGFLMGMPFPRGPAGDRPGAVPAPPFYWGLNGIFSVIGLDGHDGGRRRLRLHLGDARRARSSTSWPPSPRGCSHRAFATEG